MNRCSNVIGFYRMSTGGISGTVANPRIVFAAAIKTKAYGILISHNHPSGNLQPGREIIHLTNKIRNAGVLLGIKVLDHIIVTNEGYYSFNDGENT